VILFLCAVFRLRWYEELFEKDRQLKEPKTDDFSIFLPHIPISEEDYDGDSDLLTVIMATHLEDTLV
jgi:hypothetical protein